MIYTLLHYYIDLQFNMNSKTNNCPHDQMKCKGWQCQLCERILISDEEEEEYIFKRYSKITKTQIVNILNTYYNLVLYGKSPNPEDHFSYIAKECAISVDFVKEVFDIQLDFLVSKGIAVNN